VGWVVCSGSVGEWEGRQDSLQS